MSSSLHETSVVDYGNVLESCQMLTPYPFTMLTMPLQRLGTGALPRLLVTTGYKSTVRPLEALLINRYFH